MFLSISRFWAPLVALTLYFTTAVAAATPEENEVARAIEAFSKAMVNSVIEL